MNAKEAKELADSYNKKTISQYDILIREIKAKIQLAATYGIYHLTFNKNSISESDLKKIINYFDKNEYNYEISGCDVIVNWD